jgi:hypothetical protein
MDEACRRFRSVIETAFSGQRQPAEGHPLDHPLSGGANSWTQAPTICEQLVRDAIVVGATSPCRLPLPLSGRWCSDRGCLSGPIKLHVAKQESVSRTSH